MALVVFLRGVNVGGNKTFQPSALAKDLARYDVVNVGAAGTFVVLKPISQTKLRAELLRRLPFEAEVMICRAREVMDLEGAWREPPAKDVTRYVCVLAKRPRTVPPLPIVQPAGSEWQVKVVAVPGRFALSLHRRQGRTLLYPNQVVEKQLGVPTTTRNWNTMLAICDIIRKS